MRVELLYFDGCPSYQVFLPRLREMLAEQRVEAQVQLRRVQSAETAVAERFLGSPTLRIDGQDVEPDADRRSDFGLKCRLYRTADGYSATPPEELVISSIRRAGS